MPFWWLAGEEEVSRKKTMCHFPVACVAHNSRARATQVLVFGSI